MENRPGGKVDLKDVFCSDLRCCMKSVSTSPRPNNAYGQLVLSFQVAIKYGVPLESLASTLLSQLPDSDRQAAITRLAEKSNLTQSQIEKLLASED